MPDQESGVHDLKPVHPALVGFAQVIRFGAEQLLLATWTGSVAGGGKEPVVPASVDPVLRACIQAQAANHRQDDRHDEVKTRECQPIDGFQIESCS